MDWVQRLCSFIFSNSKEEDFAFYIKLEGKYSLESTEPCESEIRAPPQPLPYLMPIPPNMLFYNKKIYHSLFVARTWQHFIDLLKRKNPRFTAFLDSNAYTAFLDSNLHTRLSIATENELGLAFPPRNLPKKFRPDPSTLFSYRGNKQTDKQTDKPTPVIT